MKKHLFTLIPVIITLLSAVASAESMINITSKSIPGQLFEVCCLLPALLSAGAVFSLAGVTWYLLRNRLWLELAMTFIVTCLATAGFSVATKLQNLEASSTPKISWQVSTHQPNYSNSIYDTFAVEEVRYTSTPIEINLR